MSTDVACHDFLVPSVTAKLNLGDFQLIKSQGAFAGEPNSQMEGIIEGICDHYYGDDDLVASTVYNDMWIAIGQFDPAVPMVIYDGTYAYGNDRYTGFTNPIYAFFVNTMNDFTNNIQPAAKQGSTISISGMIQMAQVFKFVNQFYPGIAGNQDLASNLSTWISNHVNFTDAANALGVALSTITAGFLGDMALMEFNVNYFSGLVYPDVFDKINAELATDARSLVTLMLYDMPRADQLVSEHTDVVDVNEYNKLKSSILFTNPRTFLDPLWTANKSLGTYIYRWIGPSAPASGDPDGRNWYSKWSPWHSQSMAWGALSSFNNLIPDIYSSNPNVGVYDAYFELNGKKIVSQQAKSVFETNPPAKCTIELYNTTIVPQQNFTMRIRKDNVLNNYSDDATVTQNNISINDDPKGYGGKDRLVASINFNTNIADFYNNYGYYCELVDNSTNKASFTTEFKQYQKKLNITNSAVLGTYGTYDQGKWPISLGIIKNICSLSLVSAQFPEGATSQYTYKINDVVTNSLYDYETSISKIEAVPPSGYSFFKWSDGNMENPRNYQLNSSTTLYAVFKKINASNTQNAFTNSSQKKTKSDGVNTTLVYESMNSIWMENSANMGASWTVQNYGKPVNTPGTAHDPSIDGTDGADHFYLIGYAMSDAATNTTKIMASEIDGSRVTGTKTLINNIPGSTFDAQPVVACLDAYTGSGPSITQKAIMIWRQPAMTGGFGEALPAGLYYKTGTVTQKPDPVLPYLMVNEISWEPYDVGTYIAGTDINSFNPTVAGVRSTNTIPMVFHVAYSEKIRSNYSSVIKYTSLTLNNDGTVSQSTTQEISDPVYEGFYNQLNEKPSITLVNNLPCVAWRNYHDATYMQSAVLNRKVSASAWSGTYYYAGKDDDATSVHISNTGNMSTGYTGFVMGWNTSYSGDQFVKSSSLSTIYNSNKNGNGIQVMGGSRNDFNDSYLISYSNSSLPYSFQSSNAIPLGTLAKVSSDGEGRTVEERSGLIKLNNFFIKASLGDLTFNGNKVGFKEPKDTLGNSLEYFNGSLESESINAANGGILTYTAGYEYSDSLKALSFLKEGSHAGFSVELLDAETGLVLKKLNSFTLSPSSPTKEHAQSYRLDLSGIVMKKVALRLSSDLELKDSTKAEYFVLRHYAVQRKARKDNFVDLKYSEGARVTEYGLSQNYPNPFNPSTVINFQIPQASKVMLKVYDMLGKEVTTLVNEYKEQGSYTVEFNASSLPSGTYIYEIRANDFVKSGKMMLLK